MGVAEAAGVSKPMSVGVSVGPSGVASVAVADSVTVGVSVGRAVSVGGGGVSNWASTPPGGMTNAAMERIESRR